MNLKKLTSNDIEKMSYNELIGLVKETNRIPGGSQTIAYISAMSGLQPGKKVLDIGTSTGNTAIELANLSGANIVGIDINENSLEEARQRAIFCNLDKLLSFQLDNAMQLSLADKTFDVVVCGNVTSLLSDRKKALSEYKRVLKDTGFLVAVPMYYIKKPSKQLIRDVSKAIQVDIKPLYKDFWKQFFTEDEFDIFIEKDFAFDQLSEEQVDKFCDYILSRKHLQNLSPEAAITLRRVYREYMQLFRYNLAHMGYTVMLLRKKNPEMDPELFTAHPI